MKRLIAFLLMLIMCLSLCACNGQDEPETVTPSPTTTVTPKPQTPEPPASPFQNLFVGAEVTFGKYYFRDQHDIQDLVWIVVHIEEGKALLVTKHAIMSKNNTSVEKGLPSLMNWYTSNLFTAQEREYLLPVEIDGSSENYVFMLSAAEVEQYMPGTSNKLRLATPTAFAVERGVTLYDTTYCNWLLRDGHFVGGQLGNMGQIISFKPSYDNGIRPAVWVRIP